MATILSIEDSEFEQKVISDFLRQGGYEDLVTADTGEEGLELFDREKPRLVLLDLRLPDMDGIDVLKELKERDADVVVVSIIRDEDVIAECKELGVHEYIEKPLNGEKLVPVVDRLLGAD